MRTEKEIKNRLEEIMGYEGQMGVIDKWHLKDKNQKNKEKAIESVAETEREIDVLKWILDKKEIRSQDEIEAKLDNWII